MKNDRLVENIIRRLLRESQEEREERGRRRLKQAEGMAAYTMQSGGIKTAILYNPSYVLSNIDDILRGGNPKIYVLVRVMLGIIEIGKTHDPCNGAWEVRMSAVKNKGDGGLIYGLAFAMSPTGILTPDRRSVSQRAQQGWIQQKSRGGKPFDKAGQPANADPSDDCELHHEDDLCKMHIDLDILNRSYEEEGWENQLFSHLEAVHDETMDQLDPDDVMEIQQLMADNAQEFFTRHYYS